MKNLTNLETDYLIIGAGAMGMAFLDELIHRTKETRAIIVDRRFNPGGHWIDAYRFVRLHQPAMYYGVNSEKLGSGVPEDLVSGPKINAYYERVMEKLCKTGRVQFLLQCNYCGDGRIESLIDENVEYQIKVMSKIVDATYSQMKIPADGNPNFETSDNVNLIPINGLVNLQQPWDKYVVIGAGKTGIDAVLYLLGKAVDPERITWIMSNDSWFINRKLADPSVFIKELPEQMKYVLNSTSVQNLFLGYEAGGWIERIDSSIWPIKFRCAIVSEQELAALRRIKNIVRKGRIQKIEDSQIMLDQGVLETGSKVLHIDCSADGLVKRPPTSVFQGNKITLQSVQFCQPVFSAARIAKLEVKYQDNDVKNQMSVPVPHPELIADYFRGVLQSFSNGEQWIVKIGWWLYRSRLAAGSHVPIWQGLIGLWHLFWKGQKVLDVLKGYYDQLQEESIEPDKDQQSH
jgi:hypothetical protein